MAPSVTGAGEEAPVSAAEAAGLSPQDCVLLVRAYDVIYLEDLQVANLVQNLRLSKSISDAGWALFRTILEGKAAYTGRRGIAVPLPIPARAVVAVGSGSRRALDPDPYLSQLWAGAGP
jgi:hypothetical protein